MKISKDTEAVLNFLIEYSENNIRKLNDLGIILELCATYNEHELLNNLIFTSKSVWNLHRKIKKISPEQEGADLLKKELGRSLDTMRNMLIEVIKYSEEADIIKRFEEIYFAIQTGAMKNLIDLAHDFSIIKELQQKNK
jgi:hypothetical protein